MGEISKQELATTDSFLIFGDIVLPIPCLKYWPIHNIKETASMGNICDPFYKYKGDGLGGG